MRLLLLTAFTLLLPAFGQADPLREASSEWLGATPQVLIMGST